jgi:hypothetical protein
VKGLLEERDQAAVLVPWLRRAGNVVSSRVHDARSHASDGMTGKADERLTELAVSLRYLLESARSEFYTKAFTTQLMLLDRRLVIPGLGPTTEGEQAARLAPIQGVDQASTIAASVEKARRELALAVAATYNQPPQRAVGLEVWEKRHAKLIATTANLALGTSQVALFQAVGQLLIRPEIR